MSEEPKVIEAEDETVYRTLELRAVREEAREVDFVCSTETVDSYGTILKADWDLTRYLANPVVLYAHRSHDLPIGQSVRIGVVGKELLATVKFASEKANPFAELAFQSVLEKTLRGISVGFYPREVHEEKHGDKWVYVLSDCELRELSVTPVPSNPDALAMLRTRAANHKIQPRSAAEEGAVRSKEIDMSAVADDVAALKRKIEEREADVRVAEKAVVDARAEVSALETQNRALAKERDDLKADLETARQDLAKANDEELARHVDSFVGKKFDPAEREDLLEVARHDRKRFDRMMAQRGDLPMAAGTVVMGSEGVTKKRAADENPLRAAMKKGAA